MKVKISIESTKNSALDIVFNCIILYFYINEHKYIRFKLAQAIPIYNP